MGVVGGAQSFQGVTGDYDVVGVGYPNHFLITVSCQLQCSMRATGIHTFSLTQCFKHHKKGISMNEATMSTGSGIIHQTPPRTGHHHRTTLLVH